MKIYEKIYVCKLTPFQKFVYCWWNYVSTTKKKTKSGLEQNKQYIPGGQKKNTEQSIFFRTLL